MCLLHYCIPLFLLNWAWSAATKVHSTIRKQLLLVLALSLVQYSTRLTNMAIVIQHCMLAVWVVVALILVLCLLFAPTMPPVWPPPLSLLCDIIHVMMPLVAFICRFVVLCPVVLHADALSFHITFFFINSCLICVNVYMFKNII